MDYDRHKMQSDAKTSQCGWGRRGRDRMIVGFTTTCAISAYNH
jgi:hypothetical protein